MYPIEWTELLHLPWGDMLPLLLEIPLCYCCLHADMHLTFAHHRKVLTSGGGRELCFALLRVAGRERPYCFEDQELLYVPHSGCRIGVKNLSFIMLEPQHSFEEYIGLSFCFTVRFLGAFKHSRIFNQRGAWLPMFSCFFLEHGFMHPLGRFQPKRDENRHIVFEDTVN